MTSQTDPAQNPDSLPGAPHPEAQQQTCAQPGAQESAEENFATLLESYLPPREHGQAEDMQPESGTLPSDCGPLPPKSAVWDALACYGGMSLHQLCTTLHCSQEALLSCLDQARDDYVFCNGRYFLREDNLSRESVLACLRRQPDRSLSFQELAGIFGASAGPARHQLTLILDRLHSKKCRVVRSSSNSENALFTVLDKHICTRENAVVPPWADEEHPLGPSQKTGVVTLADDRMVFCADANSRGTDCIAVPYWLASELLPGDRVAFLAVEHTCLQKKIVTVSRCLLLESSQDTVPVIARKKEKKNGQKAWLGSIVGYQAVNIRIVQTRQCSDVFASISSEDVVLCRCTDLGPRMKKQLRSALPVSIVQPDTIQAQEQELRRTVSVPNDISGREMRLQTAFGEEPDPASFAGRRDLRTACFVTIDGADARDFDDAICVDREGKGYFLQVAIADVSHYVRSNELLDRKAWQRGNSWYFPTSVQPMLPFFLSHGLCSLMPHRERLAICAAIHLDSTGQVVSSSFAPAVICSQARLTYDEARDLVAGSEEVCARFAPEQCNGHDVRAMLTTALELSRLMKARRMERGALDFDFPEARAHFDDTGHLLSYAWEYRHELHCLIEEFMLCANEAVAAFLEKKQLPFLYRVHPEPNPESLLQLQYTLKSVAPGLCEDASLLPDMSVLIRRLQGMENADILGNLCLRALAVARYSPKNCGHYGLASRAYCHFTSPIRRYADLLVHRVLKYALNFDQDVILSGKRLMITASHLNDTEHAAQLAEREMNTRITCLWLRTQNTQTFTGRVLSAHYGGCLVRLDASPATVFASHTISDWDRLHPGDRVRVHGSCTDLRKARLTFSLVSPKVKAARRRTRS